MLIQMIIVVLFFLVGVIVFLKFIFDKYLSSALSRMQDLQARNLQKEVSLNKELERAIQYRQSEITKGREEADKLKSQAREEATKMKDQFLAQAKQEAEAALTEAKLEGERLKQEVVLIAGQQALNLAEEIIKAVFSGKSKQALGRELIDELIEDLRKLDKNKVKTDAKKAEVTSAYPISESQKNTLKEELSVVTGHEIQIIEKIDEAIISGLIINLGGVVLDGSLSSKMRKILHDKNRSL